MYNITTKQMFFLINNKKDLVSTIEGSEKLHTKWQIKKCVVAYVALKFQDMFWE